MYVNEDWTPEEKRLHKALHDLQMSIIGWCVCAALILPFPIHWLTVDAEPIYLMPVEDTTRVLELHRRHWLWFETVERIEARKNGDGNWEWMKQAKNGQWFDAFAHSESYASPGGSDY